MLMGLAIGKAFARAIPPLASVAARPLTTLYSLPNQSPHSVATGGLYPTWWADLTQNNIVPHALRSGSVAHQSDTVQILRDAQ